MFNRSTYLLGLITVLISFPGSKIIAQKNEAAREKDPVLVVDKVSDSISNEIDRIAMHVAKRNEAKKQELKRVPLKEKIGRFINHACGLLAFGSIPGDDIPTPKSNINFKQMKQQIEQELPSMKAKIAYVVNHDLSENQRTLAIQLLKDCEALTSNTIDDLTEIAEGLFKSENRKVLQDALNSRGLLKQFECLYLCNKKHDHGLSPDEIIELNRKFDNIDFQNQLLNKFQHLLCQYSYIQDLFSIADVNLKDKRITSCLLYTRDRIAFPRDFFVGICTGHSFVLQWELELRRTAKQFEIMNIFCREVLQEILG